MFAKSRVCHLDALPGIGGCKYISVSRNKTVGLYDFDISVIYETPLTQSLKRIFTKKGPTFQ